VKVVIDDRLQHSRSSREIVHETWAGLSGVDVANYVGRRAHVLLTLHVTDDIVRGISKAEPSNTALLVLVVFLYGHG
jgi:hypothetical protein